MFYGPGRAALRPEARWWAMSSRSLATSAARNGPLKPFEFRGLDLSARARASPLLRADAEGRIGRVAAIATEFGLHNVSIASLVQKDASEGVAEIIFLTHEVKECGKRAALECIEGLGVVEQVCSMIRVEE